MNNIPTFCFMCRTTHLLFGTCPKQILPVWTAPLAPDTPNVRERMHPGLAAFLDAVWERRAEMASWDKIYRLYNNFGGAQGGARPVFGDLGADRRQRVNHPTALKWFSYVNELVELERNNECRVEVQTFTLWKFSDLANYAEWSPIAPLPDSLLAHVRKLNPKRTLTDEEVALDFANRFYGDFYHFQPYGYIPPSNKSPNQSDPSEWWKYRQKNGLHQTAQRVYLNVKEEEAVKVMKFIVPSIMPGLPGCTDAKIAGPRVAGARADTIVIFSHSETTTQGILTRLSEYQRLSVTNRSRFGVEVPAMTKRVNLLMGTSVGAEPKLEMLGRDAARIISEQESFGTMRSRLIFQALTHNTNNKDRFFEAAIGMFYSARLSPMAPHIN